LFPFSVINNRIEQLTISGSLELPCYFCHFFGILVCGAHFKGNWPAACNMLGVGVLKSCDRQRKAKGNGGRGQAGVGFFLEQKA